MKSCLLCPILLLSLNGAALAQAKPQEVVRCAPDSVVDMLKKKMQGLQFNKDSSWVDVVPDPGSSDLASKARIIKDLRTCRHAHAVFSRLAIESEHWPNQVAVARVGSFYFIYEGDAELVVVDRNWKYLDLFGYGL